MLQTPSNASQLSQDSKSDSVAASEGSSQARSNENSKSNGTGNNFLKRWVPKEIVQCSEDGIDDLDASPLQLLYFKGSGKESENSSLWFTSGFAGSLKNDSHFANLVYKAVEKVTFEPCVDIYMTPLVNPAPHARNSKQNRSGITLGTSFPSVPDFPLHKIVDSLETKTLMRWARQMKPKAVINFSVGAPKIRYLNIPNDIISRLSEYSEKPAYEFGHEPEEFYPDGAPIPKEKLEGSFGAWCAAEGLGWIDISIDPLKKSFEELRDQDWKPSFGPALKWLVEGFRFDPPEEEPAFNVPLVIPALDMPPEFANL